MSEQMTFEDVPTLPVTPYAGNGGWSGSATSRARAEHDVVSGKLAKRQQQVLDRLSSEPNGMIWKELGACLGLHHGQISGALSNLHKAGFVFQLLEPRDGCLPYVHNKFTTMYPERKERPAEPKQKVANTKSNAQAEQIFGLVEDLLEQLIVGQSVNVSQCWEIVKEIETWKTNKEKP